jgi:glycosyltransferase involved in cell wall biosynthesis
LNNKKLVFYWAPFFVPIATERAVINSAYSLQKFSSIFKCFIINFFGEFNDSRKELFSKNVSIINFYSSLIIKYLPKHGKIKSRFSFAIIFFLSFVPLKRLIDKEKPDFLIIHLITSLPLILLIIFNFNTKFILRISGIPKLNFFRKVLWKLISKKIYLVTCPTVTTLNYLISLNIFDTKKLKILYDPIIDVKEKSKLIRNDKKFSSTVYSNFFLAAGRLTSQKNFLFLCEAFSKILLKYPNNKLIIAGEGEQKIKITKFIKKRLLEDKIILIGHVDNLYSYMKNAKCFILSSLWEDPGFVVIEAAFSRTPIISSNCLSGPREIIKNRYNGILFESNNINNFIEQFEYFLNSKDDKKFWVYNNLKTVKNFTLFNHFLNFNKLLSAKHE